MTPDQQGKCRVGWTFRAGWPQWTVKWRARQWQSLCVVTARNLASGEASQAGGKQGIEPMTPQVQSGWEPTQPVSFNQRQAIQSPLPARTDGCLEGLFPRPVPALTLKASALSLSHLTVLLQEGSPVVWSSGGSGDSLGWPTQRKIATLSPRPGGRQAGARRGPVFQPDCTCELFSQHCQNLACLVDRVHCLSPHFISQEI